jgi:anti-sigma regulatory factor (Ser/Thr protein kinase)
MVAVARATKSLPATARSVSQGRHFVLGVLAGWSFDDFSDTAALLTSELIANAVMHARTAIDVTVECLDGRDLVVSVRDGSPHLPSPRSASADATNGRGLALLEQLTASWDVSGDATGKTVSFTLRRDRDPWAAFASTGWEELDL